MTAVDSSSQTSEWPSRLRDIIATYFNLEELEAICFELGVDYEELGEGGKSHKIMGLIRLLAAADRIVALIDQCQALRPHVDWDALRQTAEQQPELFAVSEGVLADRFHFSGDFRGASITIVSADEAKDIESLPPEPGEAPYKGLQYFDESDADHFYGRELLTAQVIGRLHDAQFLAIIGASGSGKSSLVRAGIVPSLKRGQRLADDAMPPANSSNWAYATITPSAHPLEALAAALVSESEPLSSAVEMRETLAQNVNAFSLAARRLLSRQSAPRFLLLIDQFEEIFTLCRDETERKAFVDNLVAAADADGGLVTILITLRADFYAQCAQYHGLRRLVSSYQEYIGAMSREELARTIVQPAALGDWRIQEGLVELMLDDVGDEPGALPLLSHALLETWARRRGRTMTLSGYRQSGGVRGAIAQTAETIFDQRLSEDQRPIARMVFVRLTELGEDEDSDTPDTRRRATFSELITRATDPAMLDAVLAILTEARLITTDILPPDETKVVEVAHEALIREWPTLRHWLDQDRAHLIRHRQLTADVNDWIRLERDPGALYRGARLEQMQGWVADFPDPLSLQEQEFLEASEGAAAEEAERLRRLERARRVQRILTAVAGVLLLSVIGISAYFLLNPNRGDCTPELMSGGFNVAVAEFAVLDESGQLVNDEMRSGVQLATRVQNILQGAFGDDDDILVWADSADLLETHCVEIGVVEDDLAGVSSPAAAAGRLNADVLVYGTMRPVANRAELQLEFYLAPQFGLDFGSMVGSYAFETPVPIFDIADPGSEVDPVLAPQVEALARVARGFTSELLGRPESALADFEAAAALVPDADFTHFFVGQENLFLAQTDTTEAEAFETAAAQAFQKAPDNARAQIGLGGVHFISAQRQLNEALAEDFAGDFDATLFAIQAGAESALEAFESVVADGSQVETYGVPVDQIALLGQGISQRLLGEIAFYQDDAERAETLVDEAAATLESAVPNLEKVEDHRLRAQAYQGLGSVYEWRSFLLAQRGDTAGSAQGIQQARTYYNQCIEQGDLFPFDTYLVEEIVEKLCRPRVDLLPKT